VFTKIVDVYHFSFAVTLEHPKHPLWLLWKPVVDVTLLQFDHQTGSTFIVPVFSSQLHNMYDQSVKIYTDGSKTFA